MDYTAASCFKFSFATPPQHKEEGYGTGISKGKASPKRNRMNFFDGIRVINICLVGYGYRISL